MASQHEGMEQRPGPAGDSSSCHSPEAQDYRDSGVLRGMPRVLHAMQELFERVESTFESTQSELRLRAIHQEFRAMQELFERVESTFESMQSELRSRIEELEKTRSEVPCRIEELQEQLSEAGRRIEKLYLARRLMPTLSEQSGSTPEGSGSGGPMDSPRGQVPTELQPGPGALPTDEEEDVLNWDNLIPVAPATPSGRIRVRLKKASRDVPLPAEDPWAK